MSNQNTDYIFYPYITNPAFSYLRVFKTLKERQKEIDKLKSTRMKTVEKRTNNNE